MFADWLNQSAYIGRGCNEGTTEEAILYFFYQGLNPFIKQSGYQWFTKEDHVIARKFLYFCYMIQTTGLEKDLSIPGPKHRNLPYDRETFDYILDTFTFNDFLSDWSFCHEVCGSRFDHLIKEFCYSWIDVESGPPGKITQKILDAENEEEEEEILSGPDSSNKKKYDLY